MCCWKRSSGGGRKNGYQSGKKTSAGAGSGGGIGGLGGPPNDLWINGTGSHMRAGGKCYTI